MERLPRTGPYASLGGTGGGLEISIDIEAKRSALRIGASHTASPDDLMSGVYHLPPHPTVSIPEELTWAEDPFSDANWSFQFHSLRFVYSLLSAWDDTGERRYLARAEEVLRSWCSKNPFDDPPSPSSWDQHAASFRAMVLSCASTYLEPEEWLYDSLKLHGELLAEHYEARGNHALNQQIGLLCVGVALERREWIERASSAIERLFLESVDDEGVTNEQSVSYQYYNYARYSEAFKRMNAAGVAPVRLPERLRLMPSFLAHATMPDGRYANLGDTEGNAKPIAETPAEYAATFGRQGPRPDKLWAQYRAGFAFGRTGWGESRAFAEEAFYSVRYGPPRYIHGHADGGSVTLHANNQYLLVDSGKYKYVSGAKDPYRTFFLGPNAHNLVVCGSHASSHNTTTELVASRHESGWDFYHLAKSLALPATRLTGVLRRVTGVSASQAEWRRRVLFIRNPGFLIVEDAIVSRRRGRFEQLWHLPPDSNPSLDVSAARTQLPEGNVLIAQLLESRVPPYVICGRSNPVQGWVSPSYGERIPAPVVVWPQEGKRLRWVTLALPFKGEAPLAGVDLANLTNDRLEMRLRAYGLEYEVSVGQDFAEVVIENERG